MSTRATIGAKNCLKLKISSIFLSILMLTLAAQTTQAGRLFETPEQS